MLKDFWKHLRIYSTRKLYNLIMEKIQFILGSTHLYYFPAKITIESGNICNLHCPLCPTGQKDASASKGLLSFSDFKKIIDEIGKNLLLIRLYNWGEPLLNKELIKMAEYANKHRIAVKISTNLSFPIEDAQAEALINANLQKIYISCDGASNSTYPKYHIDGDFNRVMSNMKLLLKKKRQLRNNYTEIIWLFHVFSHNEHEINTAKLMAKEIGIKRDSKWLPDNPEYNTFNMTEKKPKNRFNCDLLWKETVINWDGCILPCCSVYSETYSFGNIKEDSFKNIWNNQKYIAARKEVLGRNNNTKTVCHVCKTNDYLYI